MHKSKILIVDDQMDSIHLVMTVLDHYEISYALSGKEALKMIAKSEYDLILLDVFMPELNGFDTCIEIRKESKYNNIPVIFLTADHDILSITKGFDVGGQDYIHKPYNSKELQARVRNNLLVRNYTKDLETKFIREKEKNRERDTILFQEFKMSQMGQAFSMIVHQWKQPLGSISTLAGALKLFSKRDELDGSYVTEKALKIEKSVSYLSDTMDTFKDFFKLKSDFEEVTIGTLIDNSLLLIKHVIKKSDTHIDINISKEDLDYQFLTIPNELIQVFLVILQNSMDIFLKKKISGTITISFKREEKFMQLVVEDDAGGIKDANLEKIFDLYFTTKGNEGSGLGLYMVKEIIKEHLDGEIKAENSEKGMKFIMKLPIKSKNEIERTL